MQWEKVCGGERETLKEVWGQITLDSARGTYNNFEFISNQMRCPNLSRSDIVRLTFEGISLAALWTGRGMGMDTQQLVRLLEQRKRERLVGWRSGWAVSLTLFLTFQKLHNFRCRRLNDILSPLKTKTCSQDFPCNTLFWGLRENKCISHWEVIWQ